MGELALVAGIAALACVAIAVIVALVVLKSQGKGKKDGRIVAATVGASPPTSAAGGVSGKAWPDVEKGEGKIEGKAYSVQEILTPTVRHELCVTLKGILEEEISRGLERAGFGERLECLEKKVLAGSPSPPTELEPQSSALPASPPSPPSLSSADLARDILNSPDGLQELREGLCFGPTERQRAQVDPPEKASFLVDEETSLKQSLAVMQRQLGKRDAQTTELHRQLRECRQSLWLQTQESRLDRQRLHDILSDPAKMPGSQAEELKRLQVRAKELSDMLAEARAQEMQWSTIAKRQRAFFMQSERMAQDSANAIRKHPAGEIFLAPPPVCLEDDGERHDRPSWDIGTLEANPYAVDSWPFEPNAMAQRAAQEPDLCGWAEGEDEDLHDPESEVEGMDSEDEGLESCSDGPTSPQQDRRPSGGMRLPSLPSELQQGCQDEIAGEPPAESARSL